MHRKSNRADRDQRRARIRELNDQLRARHQGGYVALTVGIRQLGLAAIGDILQRVCAFADFGPENDPYNEHDFGAVTYCNQRVLWKIDYYDERLEYGSEDPADPVRTRRVMTIMLAGEY